jgi:hypothetical protein
MEPQSIADTPANRSNPERLVWFPRSGDMKLEDCRVRFHQYFVGSRQQMFIRDPNADELRFEKAVKERGLCEPGA